MDPNYYSNYIQQLQQQAQLAQSISGQPQQQQQQAQLTPEQIQQQQYYYYYYYMQQMNAAAQPQNTEVSNNITPELTNASSPTIVTDSVDKKAANKGEVEKTDENSNNANDGANKSKRANKIPIYKDRKTMNLDERLYRGITKSAYYSSLSKYTTWEELVQEGCETVKYMAPFVASADCEGSSAFCVMYKMFTMNDGLTVKQMTQMLAHKNPYIKAIGLMYLRLSSPPEGLWDWFEPLLVDESIIRFHPRIEKAYGKLGKFCADLLREMKFQELILPRIPVLIYKKTIEKLDKYIKENDIDFSVSSDDERDASSERGDSGRSRSRRNGRSRSRSYSRSDDESDDDSKGRHRRSRHKHHSSHRHHHSSHRSSHRSRHDRSRSRSRSHSPRKRQKSPLSRKDIRADELKRDSNVPAVAPPQSTLSERMAKIKAMYSVDSSTSSPSASVDYKKDSLSSDTIVLGKQQY